jgi:hypothetical protein
MKESFSIREWAGPALGIALGFIFGYVLAAHGTTLVFLLFTLSVVPVVIWLSPKRPMFGWQLAIITFALCFAPTIRDYPQQPFDLQSYLLYAVLVWTGLLVLSSPWGVFLQRRAQQSPLVSDSSLGNLGREALVVALIIVGGILLLIGWAMVFAPNSSEWAPPGGLLFGTLAIAVWKACDRIASTLGKGREHARSFMQVGLLFCPLMALGGGHSLSGEIKGWSGVISSGMLGIESLAVLIWMFLTRSRGRTTLPLK